MACWVGRPSAFWIGDGAVVGTLLDACGIHAAVGGLCELDSDDEGM